MSFQHTDHAELASRVRMIRREVYGQGGDSSLAGALGLPDRTWEKYESGVTIPAMTLLKFIALTGCDPRWLLTGEEEKYTHRPGMPGRNGADRD